MSLDLIRSSNKWVTKAVLFVIAVVFIFGFGYSFVNFGAMGGGPKGAAAEVNGEEITLFEYYRLRDSMLSRFDSNAEIPDAARKFMHTRALNQLIDLKLVYQKARELGLEITDQELKESIISNPAFQIDGDFIGFAAYKNFVEQSLRENVGEFERKYKEELLAQKFIDFINETAKISDEELLNLYRIQNERIKLAYLKFSPVEFTDKTSIKDEEVLKHYNDNKDKYLHPEQREIEYVVIKPADFEKNIEISDEQVANYYASYKDKEFIDAEGNPKDFELVKDEIRASLIDKEKQVVQQEFIASLDELSKTKEISEIGKQFAIEKPSLATFSLSGSSESPVPQVVVNKAFELKQGDKYYTNQGLNIWVAEIKNIIAKSPKSLEDARDDVAADLKLLKGKELAKKESNRVHGELKGGKVKFSDLKTSYEKQYNETELFTRLDKVAQIDSKDILLNAFQLSEDNPFSKEVHKIGDDFFILSLAEKKQIDVKEFLEKKDEIKNTMLQRKKDDIYRDWILSIRKQADIRPNPNLFSDLG